MSGAVLTFEVTAAEFPPSRRTTSGSTSGAIALAATTPSARCVKCVRALNSRPVGLCYLADAATLAVVSSVGHAVVLNIATGVCRALRFSAPNVQDASVKVIGLAMQATTGLVVVAAEVDRVARLLITTSVRAQNPPTHPPPNPAPNPVVRPSPSSHAHRALISQL